MRAYALLGSSLVALSACGDGGKTALALVDGEFGQSTVCRDFGAETTGLAADAVTADWDRRDFIGNSHYTVTAGDARFECAITDDLVVTEFKRL